MWRKDFRASAREIDEARDTFIPAVGRLRLRLPGNHHLSLRWRSGYRDRSGAGKGKDGHTTGRSSRGRCSREGFRGDAIGVRSEAFPISYHKPLARPLETRRGVAFNPISCAKIYETAVSWLDLAGIRYAVLTALG